ncbi:hypothetical protein DKX38_010767 [Salix brachista]|uniref:Uncharacterized protein n=1 Tax=Salix brachista TaxID=2182728 RepID=A0A5N5MH12_9ROSI|nr:hypothetical protein DKX38_010767 [Salix brachista]
MMMAAAAAVRRGASEAYFIGSHIQRCLMKITGLLTVMEFKKEKLVKGVRKSYRFNDNQNLDKMLHVHKTSVPLEREKHRSLKLIARRYMRPDFLIDLVAALPLPQPSGIHLFKAGDKVWSLNPNLVTKNMRLDMIVIWFVIRLYLIFPSSSEIIKATRVVTETAWAGAAYNLLLYMLASHARNASLNREIH